MTTSFILLGKPAALPWDAHLIRGILSAGSFAIDMPTGAKPTNYAPDQSGIATDGTSLYVADTNSSTIRKVVIETGVVTTLAGRAGGSGATDGTGAGALFNYPCGITTDGTNLYVADTENNTIRSIQ